MVGIFRIPCPLVRNTRPSSKCHAAVDHQGFSIRAMIEATDCGQSNRVVPSQLTAARFEHSENFSPDGRGADRIQQQLHLHTPRCRSHQRSRELQAHHSSPKNIGLDGKSRLGLLRCRSASPDKVASPLLRRSTRLPPTNGIMGTARSVPQIPHIQLQNGMNHLPRIPQQPEEAAARIAQIRPSATHIPNV